MVGICLNQDFFSLLLESGYFISHLLNQRQKIKNKMKFNEIKIEFHKLLRI